MCAQLPVFVASWPEGVNFNWDRLLRKKLYGDACEAVCHNRVGNFVADAFGYQEFQSGSSATFELMPIAWRFLVMIWFEATQSDQPEITWMFRLTGLPFGSMSVLPLYVKPAPVRVDFASVGLYWACLTAASFVVADSHVGKMPFSPSASVGGA